MLVAVDITAPPVSREKLGNIVGVLSQVTSAATVQNVAASRAALRPEDVSIKPEMEGFGLLAFTRLHEAVALEEEGGPRGGGPAARPLGPGGRVPGLARAREEEAPARPDDRLDRARELLAPLRREPACEDPLETGPPRSRHAPGGPHAAPRDGRVRPRRLPDRPGDDGNVLKIVIQDRSWGRTSVRFGINLTTDFKGDTSFELATTVTRTSLNRLGGEWKVAAGVGGVQVVHGELYQPVTTSGLLFVAPLAEWNRVDEFIPQQDGSINDITRREVFAEADAGLTDRRFGELRLGSPPGYLEADSTGGSPLPDVREDRGSVEARLDIDSRDSVSFPRSGAYLHSEMSWQTPTLGAAVSGRRFSPSASPRSASGRTRSSSPRARGARWARISATTTGSSWAASGGSRDIGPTPSRAPTWPSGRSGSAGRSGASLRSSAAASISAGLRGRKHLDSGRRRQPFRSACRRLRVPGRRDSAGTGLPRVRAGGEGKLGLLFPDRRALLRRGSRTAPRERDAVRAIELPGAPRSSSSFRDR